MTATYAPSVPVDQILDSSTAQTAVPDTSRHPMPEPLPWSDLGTRNGLTAGGVFTVVISIAVMIACFALFGFAATGFAP